VRPEIEALHRIDASSEEALSKEEKQAHIHLMHNLVLDPPLSRIIIEQRR
jgi:hypothetical protein